MSDTNRYYTDTSIKVGDNDHGSAVIVRPHEDGLPLMEIEYRESGSAIARITITPDMALLVAEAITKVATTIDQD